MNLFPIFIQKNLKRHQPTKMSDDYFHLNMQTLPLAFKIWIYFLFLYKIFNNNSTDKNVVCIFLTKYYKSWSISFKLNLIFEICNPKCQIYKKKCKPTKMSDKVLVCKMSITHYYIRIIIIHCQIFEQKCRIYKKKKKF